MKKVEAANALGLIPSGADYAAVMNEQVLPALNEISTVRMLKTSDGKELYTETWPADHPKGTVLVLHGFTENALKYSELIYSLLTNGFSVVSYDQRGHGRSWRDPEVTPLSVTHVDHFSEYISDLRTVVEQVLKPFPRPWFLFSHSMGGAVAALFLEQYPGIFDRAVLNAPMIAPNLSGLPRGVVNTICGSARLRGHAKRYPFFMKPYSGPEDFATSHATDLNRFTWYDDIKAAREEFQNSVPSYAWVREAAGVTRKILASGQPEKISCPVLLFTAEHDAAVMPRPQEAFISRVPQGQRVFVKAARHEIFRSVDDVFFPWWQQILDFYGEGCVK